MSAWTKEDVERIQQRRQSAIQQTMQPAKAKYRNTRVLIDLGPDGEIVGGHLRLVHQFDSKKEAQYFAELKLRRKAGEIRDLRLQEPFALKAIGPDGTATIIGEYICDFCFTTQPDGERHICDVKGMAGLALFKWKAKHFRAQYGFAIEEIRF